MNAPDYGADAGHAADAAEGHNAPGQMRLRQLADEQAALRRVATLVARGAPADELFAAVPQEAGQLLRADQMTMIRYGSDGTSTVVASWRRTGEPVPPVGDRQSLGGKNLTTIISRTRRPARIDSYADASGGSAVAAREVGFRAAAGVPVIVQGRLWGAMIAWTVDEHPLPLDTEARLASFTELVATAIANAQAGQELRGLADTQAALRRLAILVARGEPPEAVFAAATSEALRYFGGGTARMIRYELDGTATLLANEGTTGPHVRVGERWEGYPPAGLTATVQRTGRAAQVDDYRDVPGGEPYLREGLRSAVALPIHVDGRLWGAIAVGSREGHLPAGAEQRMTEFTDLVATAVANAQNRAALEASRDELARLLAEQAALRRVATLVARGVDPAEVFSAVAEEVRRLLDADRAGIARFEHDGKSVVVLGGSGKDEDVVQWPAGTRVAIPGYAALGMVWRAGRSAQVDEDAWSSAADPAADALRELGIRSTVASPIIVEGRLWGAVTAWTRRGPFPAGTVDRMADFTELVATAVGNAESRAELTASRARIVAAADQTRRQIERDLHDGTQQRLVSLGLELRLAQSMVPAELAGLETEIGKVADELNGAVEDLREIARGIHPVILSEGGLGPALRTLARRAAIPVELDVPALGRLPEPVEVAAYYAVSEALTNATRHARASMMRVAAGQRDGCLHLSIRDDGAGGADPARGSGLIGLRDRAEALGGSLEVSSPPGQGTLILVQLPLRLH
jgi:signal transduction histidine kinase